jgi:hypothetical protein
MNATTSAETGISVESLTSLIQAYEGGVYAIIISVVRLPTAEQMNQTNAGPTGLTDEQIHSATQRAAFTDSASCSICIAPHARRGSVKLRCGHCFHRTCISQWLRRADTCPMCRARALGELG